MNTSVGVGGYLNFLAYAAQYDHPMINGLDKVFPHLIEPKLPFMAPKDFLSAIITVLSTDESLEDMAPSTKGHSDKEIREFLQGLAREIETRYPCAIRSGGFATQSGKWQSVEHPEKHGIYRKGEQLPNIDGQRGVWEFQSASPKLSSHEAVRQEFLSYYQKKIIEGAPLYKDPKKYAEASTPRLLKHLENLEIGPTVNLLRSMSTNREHPLTVVIEAETSYDWTTDDENWEWFQKLTNHIADQLKQKT